MSLLLVKDYFKSNYLNDNVVLTYCTKDGKKVVFDKYRKLFKILTNDKDKFYLLNDIKAYPNEEVTDAEELECTFNIKNDPYEYYISFSENDFATDLPEIMMDNFLVEVTRDTIELNPIGVTEVINTLKEMNQIKNIILNTDFILKIRIPCNSTSFKESYGNNYEELYNFKNCIFLLMNCDKTQYISFDLDKHKTYLFENDDISLIDINSTLETTDNKLFLLFKNRDNILIGPEPMTFISKTNNLDDDYYLVAILLKQEDDDDYDMLTTILRKK